MAVMIKKALFLRAFLLVSWLLFVTGDCPFTVNKHALVGHHYERVFNIDWLGCMQACGAVEQCYSYNFCYSGPDINFGVCELNKCWISQDGSSRSRNNFVYSHECIFQQLPKPKKKTSACHQKNNGHHTAKWIKATNSKMCVYVSTNTHFFMPATGDILSVRLIHVSGTITCNSHNSNCGAFWGCACVNGKQTDSRLDIIITDHNSNIVFPDQNSTDYKLRGKNSTIWYKIPNQSNEQQILTFPNLTTPLTVRNRDKFIVWYSSHLLDQGPSWANAGGVICFQMELLISEIVEHEPF